MVAEQWLPLYVTFDGSVLPIPQSKDGSAGVVKLIPQSIQRRTVEEMVDVPVPQIQEHIDEAVMAMSGGEVGLWTHR